MNLVEEAKIHMVALTAPSFNGDRTLSVGFAQKPDSATLMRGDVLLETRAHTAWGAAVTAQMYLPIPRQSAWHQLIDYPQWVRYFPDVNNSYLLTEHLPKSDNSDKLTCKRLYQTASKSFLFLSAQVEIYLQVIEISQQQIQFQLESGSFHDFLAELTLQDFADGTLLTYFVQATPLIPVPSLFIQQAIHFDLPTNMRTMRQALCQPLKLD
ncbi:MAG: cyclase [Leptolyngbyaceae cyanobacterium CAN_BIN12]|nr:cyclase [Leptolyngbyaceae cyanobacterium CAN_BIN12]